MIRIKDVPTFGIACQVVVATREPLAIIRDIITIFIENENKIDIFKESISLSGLTQRYLFCKFR